MFRLIEMLLCCGNVAQAPVGAPQREGAYGHAIDVMFLGEELVIRLNDLDRACWLVEGNVSFADAIPRESPCPLRLAYLAADCERLLIQRQRLARLANRVVYFAQVQ